MTNRIDRKSFTRFDRWAINVWNLYRSRNQRKNRQSRNADSRSTTSLTTLGNVRTRRNGEAWYVK